MWKMGSDPNYLPITMTRAISINRAPVLTLWAAVVAERLGFEWEEALTLGRAGKIGKIGTDPI